MYMRARAQVCACVCSVYVINALVNERALELRTRVHVNGGRRVKIAACVFADGRWTTRAKIHARMKFNAERSRKNILLSYRRLSGIKIFRHSRAFIVLSLPRGAVINRDSERIGNGVDLSQSAAKSIVKQPWSKWPIDCPIQIVRARNSLIRTVRATSILFPASFAARILEYFHFI